jgi:hypothetical protein
LPPTQPSQFQVYVPPVTTGVPVKVTVDIVLTLELLVQTGLTALKELVGVGFTVTFTVWVWVLQLGMVMVTV